MLFMKGRKEKKIMEKFDIHIFKFTKFKHLNIINLAHKHVCFGINITINFQGLKNTCITTYFMQKHAPYFTIVHYITHHMNLTM